MLRIPSWVLIILAAVLSLTSCQSPSLTTHASLAQVDLQLNWSSPVTSSTNSGAARLLLPNSAWVTVTATDGAADSQTVSQSISPANGSANVNLSLIMGATYQIVASTYTAQGGTLTGSATTNLTVGSGTALAQLNLIPPTTISLSSFQPWVDAGIPANGSQTVAVNLSDSTAVSGAFPPGSYYQNLDGSLFSPGTSASSGITTIPLSSLTPGSTGFLMTVFNPTSTPVTSGRTYFNFTLDPTKIGVAVYVLDQKTPGIDVYTLDEVTGNLSTTMSSQTSISSSSIPISFVLDPGQERLYVVESVSSGYALDAYAIGAKGSLTEIGTPVAAPSSTFAISTEQVLYWTTPNGVYSEPLAANGAPQFSTLPPDFGGSYSMLAFDAGSDGLWAVGGTSVDFYLPTTTPTTNSSIALGTTTFTALQVDPLAGAIYTVQYPSTLQEFLFNPANLTPLVTTSPITTGSPINISTSIPVLAFALSPQGQNLYYSIGTQVYSASLGGVVGAPNFQDSSALSVTHLAVDPTGRWLIASDNTNLYSIATPNLSSTGSTGTPLVTTVNDLAVIRFQ